MTCHSCDCLIDNRQFLCSMGWICFSYASSRLLWMNELNNKSYTFFQMSTAETLSCTDYEIVFLFWGSAACCSYFIKVIGRTVPRNNCLRCLFIFILPLHVLALAGHLQAEYTIIFGKLPHYSWSVVLCYRSYFVYGLANTAVVCLICGNVKTLKCIKI
jgi:hypothetical protein